MPDIASISTAGKQTVMTYRALTIAQIQVIITGQSGSPLRKVGWLWLTVRNNSLPQYQRILLAESIQTPGNHYAFTSAFGFSAVQYQAVIDWNVPGLSFFVRYD